MSNRKRHRVFVSYSHKDNFWRERLRVHLKPLEHAGLIDYWDDQRITAGEMWRDEIDKAIEETAAAVLLISPDFLASPFIVENELPLLLDAAEKKEAHLIPLILTPSRYKRTARLSSIQAVNDPEQPLIGLDKVEQEKVLLDVANKIEAILATQNTVTKPKSTRTAAYSTHDVPAKPAWPLPYQRNEYFTGREEELYLVEAGLDARGKVVLHGLGGIGKTQIAVEYAIQQREKYDRLFWIPADSKEGAMAGYQDIARQLNLPQTSQGDERVIMQGVRIWLEEHDNWLMVMDGADTPDAVSNLIPNMPAGHLLITSRVPHWPKLGKSNRIEVTSLPPTDALHFLLDRTDNKTASDLEIQAAQSLAQELGYLALALEQAAAYINKLEARFADYLPTFKNQRLSLLKEGKPEMGTKKKPLSTTWLMNFEKIAAASPAAADVLKATAFLAPDPIPASLFVKGKNWLGDAIAQTLADHDTDRLAFDKLILPLRQFSLVDFDKEKNALIVHRLVQEVIREGLGSEEQSKWQKRVLEALNVALPAIEYDQWPAWEAFESHNIYACEQALAMPSASAETGAVLHKIGLQNLRKGRYKEAEPLLKESLAIRKKLFGAEHLDTATTLNDLAGLYEILGRYVEAESLYDQCLIIRKKMLGAHHPDTATTLNDLAGLYESMHRHEAAEVLYDQCLSIRKKIFGYEHVKTAETLNDLGWLYYSQGRFDEAESLYNQCLEIKKQVLGNDHPSLAFTLNNLAKLYCAQGKYAEAEPLYLEDLSISERVLGHEHPDTATTLFNLAGLYISQHRTAEAGPLLSRCLQIREKVLGVAHPKTVEVKETRRV